MAFIAFHDKAPSLFRRLPKLSAMFVFVAFVALLLASGKVGDFELYAVLALEYERGRMAVLAPNFLVTAREFISGQIVVEGDLPPRSSRVAGKATQFFLVLVDLLAVRIFMTGNAIHGGKLEFPVYHLISIVQRGGMTCSTRCCQMGILERELCGIVLFDAVIRGHIALNRMAILATLRLLGFGEFVLMEVVMAIDAMTELFQDPRIAALMALIATHIGMLALKRELGLIVIETIDLDFFEAFLSMAFSAIPAEFSFMNVFVAGNAAAIPNSFLWRQFPGLAFGVTFHAS